MRQRFFQKRLSDPEQSPADKARNTKGLESANRLDKIFRPKEESPHVKELTTHLRELQQRDDYKHIHRIRALRSKFPRANEQTSDNVSDFWGKHKHIRHLIAWGKTKVTEKTQQKYKFKEGDPTRDEFAVNTMRKLFKYTDPDKFRQVNTTRKKDGSYRYLGAHSGTDLKK